MLSYVKQKWWHNTTVIVSLSCYSPIMLQAEAIFDGSIGPNATGTTLSGDFTIGESDGIVKGNNLFHSLSTFNVNTGESASFTHTSSNINNIITRVTGNSNTVIDGSLSSDASLWLLNPNGFIFNDNASLNISGSFYTSTADYLKFDDNKHFHTNLNANTILSIAEPHAFGFLHANNTGITLNNSILSTQSGHDISLIGGEININNSIIFAPEANTQLISANSPGELVFEQNKLNPTDSTSLGNITLSGSTVFSSSNNAGDIYIISGQLLLQQSSIIAGISSGSDQTSSAGQITIKTHDISIQDTSGIITLTTSDTDGNDINISANSTTLSDRSVIFANAHSKGTAGDITINTNHLSLSGQTSIFTNTETTGAAGNITITGQHINLTQGSAISSTTLGEGMGGQVKIDTNNLTIAGENGMSSFISTGTVDAGPAGTIDIKAQELNILNGGHIIVTTAGEGTGGNIALDIDQLRIAGQGKDIHSTISAEALSSGSAGTIDIKANSIKLNNGALISAATHDEGAGGNILVNVNDLQVDGQESELLTGITAHTTSSGTGGTINIITESAAFTNYGQVLTETHSSGNAGSIKLKANNLVLNEQSKISSNAIGFSNAGSIEINAANNIHLFNNSTISTESTNGGGGQIKISAKDALHIKNSKITTSVTNGNGNGGNIMIDPTFVILEKQSSITANATAGNGGSITLRGKHILQSPNSHIQASSELGIDGKVDVFSSEFDSTDIDELSLPILDASTFLQRNCETKTSYSSFSVSGYITDTDTAEYYYSRKIPTRPNLTKEEAFENNSTNLFSIADRSNIRHKNCWL